MTQKQPYQTGRLVPISGNSSKLRTMGGMQEPDTSTNRYLAAVMFVDIVGFTAMMQEDEDKTLAKLSTYKTLLEDLHSQYNGRIIQYYGDGALSVFQSAYHAATCAVQLQLELRAKGDLPVRIGLHLGDIVEKEGAIYGDGVNVASRIESIAVANSILLSEDIYRHLHNHSEFSFKGLGNVRFKNVQYPVEVYALDLPGFAVPTSKQLEGKLSTRMRVKPAYANRVMWSVLVLLSIATVYTYVSSQRALALSEADRLATLGVLPFDFEQLQGDDEILASGISDNVIEDLATMQDMRVLSSEASQYLKEEEEQNFFKNAQEMGLTHLLKGKVDKVDDSVKLDLSLTDAKTGKDMWTKTFTRPADEILALQRDVAAHVAQRFDARSNSFRAEPTVQHVDFKVKKLYKMARAAANERTDEGLQRAVEHLKHSIQLDSTFALGYAWLSQCYSLMKVYGFMDVDSALFHAMENVGKAFTLDRQLAEAYTAHALMDYSFYRSDPQEVMQLCQQAIQLKPSYDYAYHLIGKLHFDQGDFETARPYFESAIKLNPYEYVYQRMLAAAMMKTGDQEQAEENYHTLAKRFPESPDAQSALAQFYMHTGDQESCADHVEKINDDFAKLSTQLYMHTYQEDMAASKAILEEIRRRYPHQPIRDLEVSYYDRVGDVDTVLQILAESAAKKEDWLHNLHNMDLSPATRNHEDYLRLVEEIKLITRDTPL